MEREGRQPLFAPYDFCDFHQVVVDNVGEVICRQAVMAFPEDLVVQYRCVYFDVPPYEVVHAYRPVFGHLEPDSPSGLFGKPPSPFGFRQGEGVFQ